MGGEGKKDSNQKSLSEMKEKSELAKKTPAERKEILKNKSWETFYKKYGDWLKEKDLKNTETKFKQIWDEYAGDMSKISEETAQKVLAGEIINPISIGEDSAKSSAKFIIELINKDVLPIAALKSQMLFGLNA